MHENRSATIVIGLVAIAVYAITLFNGFAWDDVLVIVKNPILTGSTLTPFSSIDTARETDHTPYYRPLTLLSFLFEYRLHGFNPTLMHLANLILHILNAILSYFLARSITAGHRAALITALLFAVHPINTEVWHSFQAGAIRSLRPFLQCQPTCCTQSQLPPTTGGLRPSHLYCCWRPFSPKRLPSLSYRSSSPSKYDLRKSTGRMGGAEQRAGSHCTSCRSLFISCCEATPWPMPDLQCPFHLVFSPG